MKRVVLGISIALAVQLAACGGAQQRSDDFMEQVRGYNEGVRWQRYPTAAVAVPPKERDRFIEDHEDLEKELHLSDYEIVRVSGARGAKASVEVKYTWFKDSEGIVRETRALQTWERHGKAWNIVDERRVKGPEMPGLREPEPKDPKDAKDPKADDADPKDDELYVPGAPAPEAAANP